MPDIDPQDTLATDAGIDHPTRAETASAALPQLDARSYQLLEELGKGGMGEVYRTGDPALGRDLAIKIMKAQYNRVPEAEGRFLREARVTGLLQHPSIVPVHNLGRLPDGRLHYTMRLVRGRTFADILKEEAGKPERLPSLLGAFEKICQAAAYAHSKRVIHRDLKPANIMVGSFGEVQVMDWGLAKVLTAPTEAADGEPRKEIESTWSCAEASDASSGLTRAGSSMGTPAYMSPEQALGEVDMIDERADVFALGSILCEILTGQPAYSGRDSNEVLRRARRGDLTEGRARLEKCGADEALTGLCWECLSVERDRRPRDAGEAAKRVADYQMEVQERLRRAELERVEAQTRAREEQVRAIVEHERARAERRARQRMKALLLSMTAFVGLGIFTAWWIVKDREARAEEKHARELAEQQEREAGDCWSRGKAFYENGQLHEAEAEFRAAIRAKSDFAPGHNFLGAVLRKLGREEEAIASFKRAIESDPTFTFPYTNLADMLRKQGDLDGAIECIRKVIELKPKAAGSHDDLGDLLYEKGLLDEALAEYREAVRLEPKGDVFHADLGKCLWRKGLLDEAIAAYREASRLDVDEAEYPTYLGQVLEDKGQLDQAIAEYRRTISIYRQSKDGAASIGLANVLALFGFDLLKLQKYREAELVLRECLQVRQKKEPDDWATFNASSLLGEALLEQKKYAEAEPLLVKGYEGLKQRENKVPPQRKQRLNEALERLVQLYEAMGQKEKAKEWRNQSDAPTAPRKKAKL